MLMLLLLMMMMIIIIIIIMIDKFDGSDHHPFFILSPAQYLSPRRMMMNDDLYQQMIWEVDETLDGLIDYDEFQLTYHRNITDTTGSEPCYFFMMLNVSQYV